MRSSSTGNSQCRLKCNENDRGTTTEDGICSVVVSDLDGLPVRCVGDWAGTKTHQVRRYFYMFTMGMKDKWDGNTNYIEVCCGPGRCINRATGKEIEGSSMAIANSEAFPSLGKAVFIDKNPLAVDALGRRIALAGISTKAEALVGDYNDPMRIAEIVEALPRPSLNMVFIDPTDCSVPFVTIETICRGLKNVDLVITLADGTDFKRNVQSAVVDPGFRGARDKYARFLGNPDFFERPDVKKYAAEGRVKNLAGLFRESYVESLEGLGYSRFDALQVRHYYHLIFASKHETGLKFWKQARSKRSGGQYELRMDL